MAGQLLAWKHMDRDRAHIGREWTDRAGQRRFQELALVHDDDLDCLFGPEFRRRLSELAEGEMATIVLTGHVTGKWRR